jgi:hypothetical protein
MDASPNNKKVNRMTLSALRIALSVASETGNIDQKGRPMSANARHLMAALAAKS